MTDQAFTKLWRYASSWRPKILWASFYSFANKFFDVFPEILIGVAIDVVVERDKSFIASLGFQTPTEQLTILAVLTFFVWALESVTEYAALVRWRHLAQEVQHALRMDGVRHCQSLDLKWFEKQNSGQLLVTLGEDVNQIERFLNEGLHNILQLMVSSLLIGAVFFYISPSIACLALIPIPVILVFGLKFRKFLEGRYGEVRQAAADLSQSMSAMVSGTLTIRSAGYEGHLTQRIEALSHNYNRANQEAIRLSTAFVPIIRIAVLSGFLFTLVMGGIQTFQGQISPAAYTVLVFLTQRLLWPFTRFGEILDLYERSMASTRRVLGLLDTPIEIQSPSSPVSLSPIEGHISYRNIVFGYQKSSKVIRGFDLDIAAGQFIAFVGATGSGKTTLTKLLMRFYEPDEGIITLDGHNINDIDLRELRRNIGYIGQDVFLLDATIKENLCLRQPDCPDEGVAEVAQLAEADAFIKASSDGYETQIGERGQKLSGGQRQRLAIARGMMGHPPVLIMDEATSSVDNETEAAIQRSIERLRQQNQGRTQTLIVIAHRLSTVRNADRIIVLQNGQIEEEGKHKELLNKRGLYARLWDIQSGLVTGNHNE